MPKSQRRSDRMHLGVFLSGDSITMSPAGGCPIPTRDAGANIDAGRIRGRFLRKRRSISCSSPMRSA